MPKAKVIAANHGVLVDIVVLVSKKLSPNFVMFLWAAMEVQSFHMIFYNVSAKGPEKSLTFRTVLGV